MLKESWKKRMAIILMGGIHYLMRKPYPPSYPLNLKNYTQEPCTIFLNKSPLKHKGILDHSFLYSFSLKFIIHMLLII